MGLKRSVTFSWLADERRCFKNSSRTSTIIWLRVPFHKRQHLAKLWIKRQRWLDGLALKCLVCYVSVKVLSKKIANNWRKQILTKTSNVNNMEIRVPESRWRPRRKWRHCLWVGFWRKGHLFLEGVLVFLFLNRVLNRKSCWCCQKWKCSRWLCSAEQWRKTQYPLVWYKEQIMRESVLIKKCLCSPDCSCAHRLVGEQSHSE